VVATEKRILLITGAPGSGKTTVLSKTVEALKGHGVSIGGMISREAKDGCDRLGFEVIDLSSGKHGWLAHVDQKTGPQVGKYRVNLADLEKIGVKAVTEATQKYDVIVIDEIGPMELFSAKFKQAVQAALESSKVVLAVVHAKAKDPLISEAKGLPGAELFTVTVENREGLPQMLASRVLCGTSLMQ
jgi:nucleoside-triphosphatase